MKQYQYYLIDLDGTMYRGKEKIPAAKKFIERLNAAGVEHLFVTNNSTKTPAEVAENLTQHHGIVTKPDQVYTSSLATVAYLQKAGVKSVLMVGERGLQLALKEHGFTLVQDGPVDAVVVGLDRQLVYEDLARATLALRAGAKFVVTNPDTNLPSERGMIPSTGAIAAAIETASQVKPTVIGKPSKLIMDAAMQYVHADPAQTLMVGDNYQTDILAGIHAGIDTLLVYSGLSTPETVKTEKIQPTYTVQSLADWSL